MANRPKLSVEVVRAIRREREAATREGRRPRLKQFYLSLGVSPRTVYDAFRGNTFRWVQ